MTGGIRKPKSLRTAGTGTIKTKYGFNQNCKILFWEGRREAELNKIVNKSKIEMCSKLLARDKYFKDL